MNSTTTVAVNRENFYALLRAVRATANNDHEEGKAADAPERVCLLEDLGQTAAIVLAAAEIVEHFTHPKDPHPVAVAMAPAGTVAQLRELARRLVGQLGPALTWADVLEEDADEQDETAPSEPHTLGPADDLADLREVVGALFCGEPTAVTSEELVSDVAEVLGHLGRASAALTALHHEGDDATRLVLSSHGVTKATGAALALFAGRLGDHVSGLASYGCVRAETKAVGS